METCYTHKAFTWTTDHQYVVLVQNRLKPAMAKFQSYTDYMRGFEAPLRSEDFQEFGPYFNFMRQHYPGESIFSSEAKRYFGPEYTSTVFMSHDQSHVAIKLKAADAGLTQQFDIFKGANEMAFYTKGKHDSKQGHFLRGGDEYVASIEASQRVSQIVFSKDHRYCATFSSMGFELFDLQELATRAIKPVMSYSNKKHNATYERVLSVYLNAGTDGDIFANSWVVFSSRMFSMAHCIKISAVRQYVATQVQATLKLGGATTSLFFEDPDINNSIRVYIDCNDSTEDFWASTYGRFSNDGSKTVIKTPQGIYKVDLSTLEERGMPAKRVEFLNGLSDQDLVVFSYGPDDFTLVSKNNELKELSFTHTSSSTHSRMLDQQIDISHFEWKNFKLVETTQLPNETIRMLGIRNSEEIFIWERTANNTEKQYFEDMYPTRLLAIQMPYLAYSLGGKTVNICPMFSTDDVILVYKLDMKDDEEIQKLIFGQNGLYVITRQINEASKALTHFFVYRITVQEDIGFKTDNQDKRVEVNVIEEQVSATVPVQLSKRLTRIDSTVEEKPAERFGPIELINPNTKKSRETDLLEAYVYEEQRGTVDRVVFVFNAEHRLFLVDMRRSNEKGAQLKISTKMITLNTQAKKLRNLIKINQRNYVVDSIGSQDVFYLHIDDSQQGYSVQNVFTELSNTLICTQADSTKLYILVKDRVNKYYVRVMGITGRGSISFQQISFIALDPEDPNTDRFIDAFMVTRCIMDGVMLHDEEMMSKIYHESKMPSIQFYKNFLPPAPPQLANRIMVTSQLAQNHHDRKIAMLCSFPQTGPLLDSVKICLVMPYFNENVVYLTNPTQSNLIWLSHSEQTVLGQVQTIPYVYQFNTKKWRLQKFNLKGICIQGKTFKTMNGTELTSQKDDIRKYKLLAMNDKKPQFLLTPPDNDFMKVFYLISVTDQFTLTIDQTWSTSTLEIDNGEEGVKKQTLYQAMMNNQKQGNSFNIQINARKEIAIGFVDRNDDSLLRMFLVLLSNELAGGARTVKFTVSEVVQNQNQISEQQSRGFLKRFKTRRLDNRQPLLGESKSFFKSEEAGPQVLPLGAKGFEFSDTKLMMWNEQQIYFSDIRKSNAGKRLLEEVQFQLKVATAEESKDAGGQNSYESQIIEVCSRTERSEVDPAAVDSQTAANDYINIKVQIDLDRVALISYDMETNRQISSLSGTTQAQFIFDSSEACYVFDKHGITKLSTGETYPEYRVGNTQDPATKSVHDLMWGHRLVPSNFGMLFLVDDKVHLPYSQVSYIQMCQDIRQQNFDNVQFYPQDYYKIKGQTTLHKYKYDPMVLEKILDCYWQLDKKYVLSVLVKSQTFQSVTQEAATKLKATQSVVGGINLGDLKKTDESPAASNPPPRLARFATSLKNGLGSALFKQTEEIKKAREIYAFVGESDKMILEYLIEISHDKLINQILYMLSRLPVELTFNLTVPLFKDLQEYSRFQDYLNKWFDKTAQLEQVTVLYTSIEEQVKEYRSNLGLLDKTFFDQYPVSKKKLPTYPLVKTDEVQPDAPIDDQLLRPVQIKMMQTKWFFEQEGKDFFQALIDSEDITLFSNVNLQRMIDFQWTIFIPFYRNRIVYPYLLGCYLPFIVITLDNHVDDQGSTYMGLPGLFSFLVLGAYMYYALNLEWLEAKNQSFLVYLKDVTTIMNLSAMLLVLVTFLFSIKTFYLTKPDNRAENLLDLRNLFVFGILVLNLIMLYYIKVFDFWSTFVRSLVKIIYSSLPLGACLAIFVITQSLMFWILYQNQPEKTVAFPMMLMDAYRLALGDFNILGDFENPVNKVAFWIIFFVGTLIQMLIILNMVIAVMSSAFDEVNATNEANIFKAKLECLRAYDFQCMRVYSEQFKQFDYLYVIEVDPVVTDIGPTLTAELPESQTKNEINDVKKQVVSLQNQVLTLKQAQANMVTMMYEKLVEIQYMMQNRVNQ